MTDITKLHISQISNLIQKKEISPVEIVSELLSKIDHVNVKLNAYIEICADSALEEARISEKEILSGSYKGNLHGIPISIKDLIAVKGTARTNGSKINRSDLSPSNASVITELHSNGAIIIGKTNMDEFANHTMGINNYYGTIKNPINTLYSAGGSSGGSAVSVAAGLAYGSIGTDTAGSIRIPASCCGIVGLKPTYNLISTSGVTPLSWSLDHVGPLGKNCEDVSILFNSIVPGAKQNVQETQQKVSDLIIGVPENYFFDDINNEVQDAVNNAINTFETLGFKIIPINIKNIDYLMSALTTIGSVEAAYFHQQYVNTHATFNYEDYNYESIQRGMEISTSEYTDALTYKQKFTREMSDLFLEVDILIAPTMPIAPPKLTTKKTYWEKHEEDILSSMIRYTGPFNITGFPALSVPVSFHKNGLPIGLQLIGNLYKESLLLYLGDKIFIKEKS